MDYYTYNYYLLTLYDLTHRTTIEKLITARDRYQAEEIALKSIVKEWIRVYKIKSYNLDIKEY